MASLSPVVRGEEAEEPRYHGRSLNSWIDDFAVGRFPDMERHNAAVEVIREIGADSLPTLMKRIRTTGRDPALLLSDESERLRQITQDIHTVSAFRALGSVAQPEIPTLIEMLAPEYDAAGESPSGREYWLKYRSSGLAGNALEAIGASADEPLRKALESDDPKIRFGAAEALESAYRRSKDEQIVSALVKRLRDDDANVRWASARVLGSIHTLPETCVPALAERVRDDPSTNVRCYALNALKKFGPQARAAVPDLTAATSDKDSAIRLYAREALEAIQAEEATDP